MPITWEGCECGRGIGEEAGRARAAATAAAAGVVGAVGSSCHPSFAMEGPETSRGCDPLQGSAAIYQL